MLLPVEPGDERLPVVGFELLDYTVGERAVIERLGSVRFLPMEAADGVCLALRPLPSLRDALGSTTP